MKPRERMIRTLAHEAVDAVPRQLWNLSGVRMFRPQELEEVRARYPSEIEWAPSRYGTSRYLRGEKNVVGSFVDEFGSVRTVAQAGVSGEVTKPVLASWDDLDGYEFPWEMLENADFSAIDPLCAATDRFVLAGTWIRPFERLQFMRGTENLLVDLALGEPGVERLLSEIHRFNLAELDALCKTRADGIFFMDDWGSQRALLVDPALWRTLFRPLYKEYCERIRNSGKFVFMHSDGHIESIYPDLVDIGVSALNSQLFCMDLEALALRYGDRMTFWGEIDRQHLLPFGTPEEVRAGVDRVARATIGRRGRTGVIAQCEWGNDVPKENIEAVFDQWSRY